MQRERENTKLRMVILAHTHTHTHTHKKKKKKRRKQTAVETAAAGMHTPRLQKSSCGAAPGFLCAQTGVTCKRETTPFTLKRTGNDELCCRRKRKKTPMQSIHATLTAEPQVSTK